MFKTKLTNHSIAQTWNDYHSNNQAAVRTVKTRVTSALLSDTDRGTVWVQTFTATAMPQAQGRATAAAMWPWAHGLPLLQPPVRTDIFSMQRDRKLLPGTNLAYGQTGNRKFIIPYKHTHISNPSLKKKKVFKRI